PCAGIAPKCMNGGAPNPRNCSRCICPFGYGGTLCEKRRAGCGRVFEATTKWNSRTITVGDATVKGIRDTYTTCNDWITDLLSWTTESSAHEPHQSNTGCHI
ncbi:hypothetical protein TELCIR_18780, partial [Teladorsagia circumcincta]